MFSCLVIYFLKKTEKMPHSISGILAFFFILYNTWCSLQEALIETVSVSKKKNNCYANKKKLDFL